MPGSERRVTHVCCCLLGTAILSLAAAAESSETRPNCIEEVNALFARWDKQDSPGAVLGVFKDGEVLHARGYGIANLDYGIPLSPRTALRTGSITKQFVAAAIALLAEQGKLDTNDNIRKYLPEMPDYGTPITLANLIHHTSGIREYLTLVTLIGKPEGSGYVYTPEELLSMLARQKALEFVPGEKFSYSNSGYFLLAEVISRVAGTSASDFLEKQIFAPLGMYATRLHDDPDAIVPNRGIGYSLDKDGGYRLDILRLKVVGDLGVITSVEDFFKWDQNFYKNRLGSKSPELMETLLTTGNLNSGARLDYAYGLIVGRYRGLKTIGHGGSAVGYVSHYLRFPEQRFSVIVLANLSSLSPAKLARRVADSCLADDFTEPPVSISDEDPPDQDPPTRTLSALEIAEYRGDYYSDELDVVYRLGDREGELILTINALSGSLRERAEDHLWWNAGEADFHFSTDSNGEIEGFSIHSGSVRNLRFTKLEH